MSQNAKCFETQWLRLQGALKGIAVAVACLSFGACDFQTSDGDVDKAIAKIAEGDLAGAAAAFDNAAAVLPESAPLNFGRGVARVLVNDNTQAVAMLLRALETKDPNLRQKVHAAIGVAYARDALRLEAENPVEPGQPIAEAAMTAWKQAVAFLEDALALNPADFDARTNLEVALLRVDPPCSARDDALEENDSAGTARAIELAGEAPPEGQGEGEPGPPQLEDLMKFQEQLFSCPDDDDWYRVEAHPGDRLEFKLTVPDGGGRLAMQVFDAANRLVGEGPTVSHIVPIDAAPGPVFISVRNVDFDEVSYSLGVELRPACARVEDRFESNDSPLDARSVTPGPVPDLKLCPANDDWFALELAEGESVFIFAEPAQNKDAEAKKDEAGAKAPEVSPLLLDVFRGFNETGEVVMPAADSVPLTRGGQTGKARVATLLTPGAGRYYFRVSGADPAFEGRYSLMLEIVPPCPEGDDRFEDNDIAEDATDFDEASAGPAPDPAALEAAAQQGGNMTIPAPPKEGPPVVFARICPGDVDWWKVSDDPNEKMPAIVSLTFDHGQGDLMMSLYDESGVEMLAESDASEPDRSGEALVLPRPEVAPTDPAAPKPDPGDAKAEPLPKKPFLIKVSGKEGSENFYLLRIDRPSPSSGDGDNSPDEGDEQDENESEDGKDENEQPPKDKDEGDSKQDPDEKPQQDPKDQSGKEEKPRPLEDVLDKLDRNPENLEARDSAKKSPLAGQKPMKDW